MTPFHKSRLTPKPGGRKLLAMNPTQRQLFRYCAVSRKQLLFIHFALLLWLFFARDVAGQGILQFNNNSATAITNANTNARLGVPGATVALYYSEDTNAVGKPWLPMKKLATTNLATLGLFLGSTRTVPDVPPGGYIAAEVFAWTLPFDANSEAETVKFNWDHGGICNGAQITIFGRSGRFLIGPLGSPGNPAPTIGAHMPPFQVASRTYSYDCISLTVLDGSPTRLRLDMDPTGRTAFAYLVLETCTELPRTDWSYERWRTNWQRVTVNWTNRPASFPYFWTNTLPTPGQRFFRVWLSELPPL